MCCYRSCSQCGNHQRLRDALRCTNSINATTILTKSLIDWSMRFESDGPLNSYAEVIKTLATRLHGRFCVFYKRESTLEALRFVLPRERTIDLSQHIHSRNDALSYGGIMRICSRNQLIPLECLWLPILKSVMPTTPVARAHCLIRMFRIIMHLVKAPLMYPSSIWFAVEHWYSNWIVEHELSASLLIEIHNGQLERRRQRYADALLSKWTHRCATWRPFTLFCNWLSA